MPKKLMREAKGNKRARVEDVAENSEDDDFERIDERATTSKKLKHEDRKPSKNAKSEKSGKADRTSKPKSKAADRGSKKQIRNVAEGDSDGDASDMSDDEGVAQERKAVKTGNARVKTVKAATAKAQRAKAGHASPARKSTKQRSVATTQPGSTRGQSRNMPKTKKPAAESTTSYEGRHFCATEELDDEEEAQEHDIEADEGEDEQDMVGQDEDDEDDDGEDDVDDPQEESESGVVSDSEQKAQKEMLSPEQLAEEKQKVETRIIKSAKRINKSNKKRAKDEAFENAPDWKKADMLLSEGASIRARYIGLVNKNLPQGHPLGNAVPSLRASGQQNLDRALEIIERLSPEDAAKLWRDNGRNKGVTNFEHLMSKKDEQIKNLEQRLERRIREEIIAELRHENSKTVAEPEHVKSQADIEMVSNDTPVDIADKRTHSSEDPQTVSVSVDNNAARPQLDPQASDKDESASGPVRDAVAAVDTDERPAPGDTPYGNTSTDANTDSTLEHNNIMSDNQQTVMSEVGKSQQSEVPMAIEEVQSQELTDHTAGAVETSAATSS